MDSHTAAQCSSQPITVGRAWSASIWLQIRLLRRFSFHRMWLYRLLTSTMCALIYDAAGSEGMAFITDSSQNGPNGIIVVDLASGKSWRRLHDHPSTKAEQLQTFLPIVEGRPFLEHQPDGSVKQGADMGSDGIAISSDGTRPVPLSAWHRNSIV